MALHIITGPPASGKTTFIQQHAKPGDIRIDLDHLANLLAGQPEGNHEHAGHALAVARAARTAAIDTALKQVDEHTVWIIDSKPTEKNLARYREHGAEIHTIDPGKDVVMKRAKRERPTSSLHAAAQWYNTPPRKKPRSPAKSREARGYGNQHKLRRQILMNQHKEGTPCWWCGSPMYRDKTKNWDGKPLAADHSTRAASAGGEADRLLCFTCNSRRQGGANDHLRPVITGLSPADPLPTDYNQSRGKAEPTGTGFSFGGVTFA